MQLFLIVWYYTDDGEPDWCHVILEDYPTEEERLELVREYTDNPDLQHDDLEGIWANVVDVVWDYKVKVEPRL